MSWHACQQQFTHRHYHLQLFKLTETSTYSVNDESSEEANKKGARKRYFEGHEFILYLAQKLSSSLILFDQSKDLSDDEITCSGVLCRSIE